MLHNKRFKSGRINHLKLWMLYTFSTIFVTICTMTYAWSDGIVELPATGQTKCYDSNGNEIACAGTG